MVVVYQDIPSFYCRNSLGPNCMSGWLGTFTTITPPPPHPPTTPPVQWYILVGNVYIYSLVLIDREMCIARQSLARAGAGLLGSSHLQLSPPLPFSIQVIHKLILGLYIISWILAYARCGQLLLPTTRPQGKAATDLLYQQHIPWQYTTTRTQSPATTE